MKFFESLFAGNFNDNPDYFKLIRIFEIFFILGVDETGNLVILNKHSIWRHSQVVRQRSATPLSPVKSGWRL